MAPERPAPARQAGWQPARAAKEYLRILHLAARESEASVEAVLTALLDAGSVFDATAVDSGVVGDESAGHRR